MQKSEALQTKKLVYSAPGKCILSGEHSVVYGYNAIAISLDLRTRCTLEYKLADPEEKKTFSLVILEGDKQPIELSTSSMISLIESDFLTQPPSKFTYANFLQLTKQETETLERLPFSFFFCFALINFNSYIGNVLNKDGVISVIKQSSTVITVTSEIPFAKGLGSSASFSVSLAACLLHFWIETLAESLSERQRKEAIHLLDDKKEFDKLTNTVAFGFETVFHGTPSGVDNLTVLLGGAIVFNKTSPDLCYQLKSSLLTKFDFLLVDTGVEKDTKKSVEMIRKNKEDSIMGPTYTALLEGCGRTTDGIKRLLELEIITLEDERKLEELIVINQKLLEALNISHQKNDELIIERICKKQGFACKLTGGGLGGSCVCLISQKKNQEAQKSAELLLNELKQFSFDFKVLKLAEEGLRSESRLFNPSL